MNQEEANDELGPKPSFAIRCWQKQRNVLEVLASEGGRQIEGVATFRVPKTNMGGRINTEWTA